MRKKDAKRLVALRGAEVIKFGSLIGPKRVNIKHRVVVGGGSYTNGVDMTTGLFDFMIDDKEDEFNPKFNFNMGLFALRAVTAHEYGHVWFTNHKQWIQWITKMSQKFEADGIDKDIAMKVSKDILNITEDGRIEKRMVNLHTGLKKYFQWLNATIWELRDPEYPNRIDDNGFNKDEFNNLFDCTLFYTKLGIYPKWYKETKGTTLRTEFERAAHFLDDCVNSNSFKELTQNTEKFLDEIWDYLIELLKRIQEDEEQKNEMMGSGEGEGSTGSGGSAKGGIGGGGADDFSDSESKTGVADGTKAGNGDESARINEPGKGGDNTSLGMNGGKPGEDDGPKKEPEYGDTEEMSDEVSEGNFKEVTGGGSTKVNRLSKKVEIEEAVDKILRDGKVSAEQEAAKKTEVKKEKPKTSSTMTKDEVSRMINQVGYDKEYCKGYREIRQTYDMIGLPDDLKKEATRFRNKIKQVFNQKNTKVTKMNSGRLDVRQLHKLSMNEYNIFSRNLNRSVADAVVEICWDGSGSMWGGKQEFSGRACAIVEHGLRGLVPLKIINFSTSYNADVIHYLVKDWDDSNPNINYALSYTKSKGFNGGNKDGYSIRVCTEDLMKRPESDKIMIVMSDGLPSDYNSINPLDDVKDAVKQARKKGITVIPIFFGDEYFRDHAWKDYEFMYEKFLINASPEELPDRIQRLFKKVIK